MKKLILVSLLTVALSLSANAQKFPGLDRSPRDMSYFPASFTHKHDDGQSPVARILYSRPFANGRQVFGKLIPYGKVDRLGADESTELTLYKDATVNGTEIKAGTYSLFILPEENAWTIIFNSELHRWGAYSYKEANDVARVTVPITTKTHEPIENLSILFDEKGSMLIGWETAVVEVPFKF